MSKMTGCSQSIERIGSNPRNGDAALPGTGCHTHTRTDRRHRQRLVQTLLAGTPGQASTDSQRHCCQPSESETPLWLHGASAAMPNMVSTCVDA